MGDGKVMNLEGRSATWRASRARAWRPHGGLLNTRFFITMLLVDLIAISISFVATGMIYDAIAAGGQEWLTIFSLLLPVYVAAALNSHAYSPDCLRDRLQCVGRGVRALLLALCVIILVAFALKTSANFSRLNVVIGALLSMVSLGAARYLFAGHVAQILGANPYNVVVISDGGEMVPDCGEYSILLTSDFGLDPAKHDPVMYDRLATALAGADRVVVACRPEQRIAWASALKGANIQSEVLIPELQHLAPLGVAHHGAVPTVIVATGPLGLFDRFLKRSFDIVVAGLALVLLSPVFLLVALAIVRDSPGPILFKQTRIGRANQMFEMLKFRSMRAEESDGAGVRSTSRDDDRITRVGRFIRRTSIDELPQLLNVLAGDMSIVGPRPHAIMSRAADKLFWEVDERYWHRHAAKPGLTGLAQIRGYRGATFREDDLTNRLQADLEYLDHWTIWRDIRIVLVTFKVLLHRNAF